MAKVAPVMIEELDTYNSGMVSNKARLLLTLTDIWNCHNHPTHPHIFLKKT